MLKYLKFILLILLLYYLLVSCIYYSQLYRSYKLGYAQPPNIITFNPLQSYKELKEDLDYYEDYVNSEITIVDKEINDHEIIITEEYDNITDELIRKRDLIKQYESDMEHVH